MTDPSDPSGVRRDSKRKRDPVTLDLEATEVAAAEAASPREAPREESSLVADPRTPEDPPETAFAAQESMPDDPRAGPAPEPTPGDIEAAVERLIPEGEGRGAEPDIAPARDVGEAPSEPAPGPDALDAVSAMPAGAAADRIDGRPPDEPAAAPAAMPEPRRRAGLAPLLAAAILGGLVGAGLLAAAERYWLNKPAERVRARVGQIEARLATTPRVDLGPVEQRLSALETQQRETARRAQAAQAAAEAARAAAEQAPGRPAEQVAGRPAEAGSAQPVAGSDPAVLERIEARIAALESQARGQAEAASQGARELQERVAEQSRQVATLEPRLTEQDRRLGEIATRSSEQGQRLAALSGQLEEFAKKFSERGPEATAALRVVAADRVIDALRDGAPFPEAFAALNRLGGDQQRLAAVEPFAKPGAPTAGALAQEFKPVAQTILSEARGPAESWSDRLSRMAEGIVTVRPVGEAGQATVPGLVARIEGALARGALADAAAAWDALPEGARRGAEAFGRRLKSRAAAEDAARGISNQALAALDAATR